MEYEKIREFKNKKSAYKYFLSDRFVAGIQLKGTEIKSIRNGKINFSDSYCYLSEENEIFIKGLHIAEYKYGTIQNHEPLRERKLLLNKKEIRKIRKKLNERGFTLIPTSLFIDERGIAKIELALAQGKNLHDKRNAIKEKDQKRDMKRINNMF